MYMLALRTVEHNTLLNEYIISNTVTYIVLHKQKVPQSKRFSRELFMFFVDSGFRYKTDQKPLWEEALCLQDY